MPKVKITCDSTCDLSSELYERYHISAIPLSVALGERFCRDGVDVEPQELFDYVEKTGEIPTTSAISVGEYEDFFRPFVEDGYEVVHINLSAELSSSHQNARLAAKLTNWKIDIKSETDARELGLYPREESFLPEEEEYDADEPLNIDFNDQD